MDKIVNDYINWLLDLISMQEERFGNYTKLVNKLYSTEFTWDRLLVPRDVNRATDGENLRYKFGEENGYSPAEIDLYFTEPCNVLEMMIALACRCENQIMVDYGGDPVPGRWFITMLQNLHLYSETDDNYEEYYVEYRIDLFLNRHYQKNGDGGLFVVREPRRDMRKVEIWFQMNWYLSEYLGYD